MINYLDITTEELQSLNREKTIFLMSIAPLEAHGPHLPLGTDIYIAEELLQRNADALKEEFPSYSLVKLPPLILGSDPLPLPGSFSFPALMLKRTLLSLTFNLSRQGFRYLFISDNHGGPRHHLAVESASRRAFKKYGFIMVNPFELIFRMMIQRDEELLKETALEPGSIGDHSDCHAGTNETSLMLKIAPDLIKQDLNELPAYVPPTPSNLWLFLGRTVGIFSTELHRDLQHLCILRSWIKQKPTMPYLGAPSKACRENGEKMLYFHRKISMELFRQALKGQHVKIRPLLWKLRFIQYLP